MIFDNRYFPWIQYPYVTVANRCSHVTGDFFITTASRAADTSERDIGIAELSGYFDLSQFGYSFILGGIPSPLNPIYIPGQLPFDMQGKLQSQGFSFSWQQYVGYNFTVGLWFLVMRSNSYIDFNFNFAKATTQTAPLTNNDIIALDQTRREMFSQLGLACNHVHQHGPGDLDFYLRWADEYSYIYKLRNLQYGIRLGALVPTGVKRNIFEPASVPFGGNGHWGVYGAFDGEFEVREDWKAGYYLRLSKRFAKTRIERLPVDNEPQIFGVLTGPVRINPGFTTSFFAYGQWEGLREGLGLRLQYTVVSHQHDHWTDERVVKAIPAKLDEVDKRSGWASEYVTLSAFYDFDKLLIERGHKPIVRAMWDIPVSLLVAQRFVKSYKVSLGLEFNY